jgi:hypothetical protein
MNCLSWAIPREMRERTGKGKAKLMRSQYQPEKKCAQCKANCRECDCPRPRIFREDEDRNYSRYSEGGEEKEVCQLLFTMRDEHAQCC